MSYQQPDKMENRVVWEGVVKLPRPHPSQWAVKESGAKRVILKAGRRFGKTVLVAIKAVELFLSGRRVLYGTPTNDQIERFWAEVTRALAKPIEDGILKKNETKHAIGFPGKDSRIRAKTCWNADTLRGDYADYLILDEFQLMNEDTWEVVGAPMLLDNNGDAIFLYTPPTLRSLRRSKARDSQHAAKRFKEYQERQRAGDKRYAAFHFRSMDNPHLSKEALAEITQDMTSLAHRMEILAEEVNEAPGALWSRETIDRTRVHVYPDLDRIVVAIDPSITADGEEAGIVGVGKLRVRDESFVLADRSVKGGPKAWSKAAVGLYRELQADCIVAEVNQGGEMVSMVIQQADSSVPVKMVHASRGKRTRAEPVVLRYDQGKVHHVGFFPYLEDEMCLWIPGDPSPNRMDALVWAETELSSQDVNAWGRPLNAG